MTVEPPLAVLAELTHRCPFGCLYCSNPAELEDRATEMDTDTWRSLLSEAADLGALQVHFSGGEPVLRDDLVDLVAHATDVGLYANLISAGIPLTPERVNALAEAGLEHVQISFDDTDANVADWVSGLPRGHVRKLEAAKAVRAAGLALTVNAVMHRRNMERVSEMVDLALMLGARRLEIANVQYYGWAAMNRHHLMPTRAQLEKMTDYVEGEKIRLRGQLVIDYVIPDYYARQPKSCMSGWGRRFINVTPSGKILPCHAAETVPGLVVDVFPNRSLSEIWYQGAAFNRFRGTDWMREPCRSCDQREIDWGGCRCQALAITGDAANADPVCEKSPHHAQILRLAETSATGTEGEPPRYRGGGRRQGNAPAQSAK